MVDYFEIRDIITQYTMYRWRKKNYSCNNFEVGTANGQDVASLLGVRCQDNEKRVFRIHSLCVFEYGWSGNRETCCIQKLSGANCTEAKIRNMVQLLHLVYLPPLFPRLEQVSIPYVCVCFCFCFFFAKNQASFVLCDR